MYDIISIGSATRDVYIESDGLTTIETDKFDVGKGICVPAGSKVGVQDIHFTTGGSAVNAAVTFANRGFKTACVAKVGEDSRGLSIQQRLLETGVATDHLTADAGHLTAYSVIAHSPQGERTIFVYRGASREFTKEEFPFDVLQDTKWIFVTHLGGKAAAIFSPLIKAAHEAGVKVALNPGSTQLKMGKKLVPLLNMVDILFVNREEAAHLTGVDYKKEEEIFTELDEMVKGLAVMTKGKEGSVASDGETRWEAGILEEERFVDRTGAGDAFAAGFTSAIIKGGSVEEALQLGSANATGVVSEWGANHGLLAADDKPDKFGKLEIKAR